MLNMKIALIASLTGAAAVLAGYTNSDAVASRGSSGDTFPDVIVGSLPSIAEYGAVGGISAYAVATTSCNQGNDFLLWQTNNNNHPTIGQNMYRVVELPNGCSRVEQIGMSWLKHGFCALQQTLCGSCSNPASGGCADRLGWNCSDPYSDSLNGQQSNLGPRWQVNASTGFFEYPYDAPAYPATIGRRLQVATADLDTGLYPDSSSSYFVEGAYVHPDDAAACMAFNNASYRPVTRSGSPGDNFFNLNVSSTTRQMLPAIFAWEEVDPEVTITQHQLSNCEVSGQNENFFVGSKVCDLGNGMWHYEYAIYNLDCHDSFAKFVIPLTGTYENVEHSFAPYHSNEPFGNAGWAVNGDNSALSWSCKPFATDQNSNAIRFNTMHTFSFDADSPPIVGEAVVGTFRTATDVVIQLQVPEADQLISLSPVGSIPELVSPSETTLSVEITELQQGGYADGSAQVIFNTGSGDQSVTLSDQGGDIYSTTLTDLTCGANLNWYFSAEDSSGTLKRLPLSGTYSALVAEAIVEVADVDFEVSEGWTVSTTATAGGWERGIPSTDSTSVDSCSAPGTDADDDGSGYCYVTGNGVSASACANDIDGGSTVLTSAVYAVDSPETELSFAWWYDNTSANNTEYDDVFVIEISGDSGDSWTQLASISNGNSAQTGWTTSTWRVGDYVNVTSGLQLRFTASDNDPGSVVEAGIDAFKLVAVDCGGGSNECLADIDGDNTVGGTDLAALLASWQNTGSDVAADLNDDGTVNGLDLAIVLAGWGLCSE